MILQIDVNVGTSETPDLRNVAIDAPPELAERVAKVCKARKITTDAQFKAYCTALKTRIANAANLDELKASTEDVAQLTGLLLSALVTLS